VERGAWDEAARTFDDEPDHGLTDPHTRAAWRELLLSVLPEPGVRVADLGCGTGTLTGLLSDEGYLVDGLDFSEEMIRRARAKVPQARFLVGDASRPALEKHAYEVVLSRHVLWALSDPEDAFARWIELLRPGGIVVLVEGRWSTGAGLTADDTVRIVRSARAEAEVIELTNDVYWGKQIDDERYVVISRS
jgi:SAM-dependent methyltransferase